MSVSTSERNPTWFSLIRKGYCLFSSCSLHFFSFEKPHHEPSLPVLFFIGWSQSSQCSAFRVSPEWLRVAAQGKIRLGSVFLTVDCKKEDIKPG